MVSNFSKYGPPMSDSDDDYDIYCSDEPIQRQPTIYNEINNDEHILLVAMLHGQLEEIKNLMDNGVYTVDSVIEGSTLLLMACREGHYDIVKYLIKEKSADVNKHIDSITPLMAVCEVPNNANRPVMDIVRLLIRSGAEFDITGRRGTTPFMLACKTGHVEVVKFFIEKGCVHEEDNLGYSPLFYAIENNRAEIVKLLVDAGVKTTGIYLNGYSPLQIIEFHGFYDLIPLLPKVQQPITAPVNYLNYCTIKDYIPQIFLKSECPEYFPEIYTILLNIQMSSHVGLFAKSNVSLSKFLTITDSELESCGIKLPFYRSTILKAILNFHLHNWTPKSIVIPMQGEHETFYDILIVIANQLQNLVLVESSIQYVAMQMSDGKLGTVNLYAMDDLKRTIDMYKQTLKCVIKSAKYITSFTATKYPLYIDYDVLVAERKRTKINKIFKYTTVALGVSVFVCLKLHNSISLNFLKYFSFGQF